MCWSRSGWQARRSRRECFAFGRHPKVSEQVWSGSIGYPGTGVYLEFHKKHGERGLRYWKVTNNKAGLGSENRLPDDVECEDFSSMRSAFARWCTTLCCASSKDRTGRQGVCVAPFDAELFGHWWFEGPRFLRDVILTMSHETRT